MPQSRKCLSSSISGTLKLNSDRIALAVIRVFLALSCVTICLAYLTSCKSPSREEIEFNMWQTNTPLPQDICGEGSPLLDRGFVRRLNDGHLEFVSFCSAIAGDFLAIHKRDFQNLLDKYVPKTSDTTQTKESGDDLAREYFRARQK